MGQHLLGGLGVHAAPGHVFLEAGDVFQGLGGQQFVITPHEIVGDGHDLAEDLGRGFVDADIVAVGLGHLAHAVQAFQQGHGQDALAFHAVVGLEVAAHQQVELLVGTAHFHIGLEGHGVIALAEGIDEFVDGDGALLAEALFKVVALHHAGHGVAGGQADEVRGVHLAQPVGIEFHDGLFGIEDLEDLLLVGLGIGDDLFLGQGRTGLGAAGGVADAAGEVTDQEDDLVAQFLKVAHLVHDHGVAQMQVGSGGVKAHLHAQGRAAFQFLAQFLLVNQLRHAALDHGHLAINIHHRTSPCVELARHGRYPGRIASAKRGCQCSAGGKDEKGSRGAGPEGQACAVPCGRQGAAGERGVA